MSAGMSSDRWIKTHTVQVIETTQEMEDRDGIGGSKVTGVYILHPRAKEMWPSCYRPSINAYALWHFTSCADEWAIELLEAMM